jgi:hypothetical protein
MDLIRPLALEVDLKAGESALLGARRSTSRVEYLDEFGAAWFDETF